MRPALPGCFRQYADVINHPNELQFFKPNERIDPYHPVIGSDNPADREPGWKNSTMAGGDDDVTGINRRITGQKNQAR